VIGPILILVFLAVAFPIGLFMAGALVAALHGWAHTDDAEHRFADSELLPLSR
jgi:hypothetical protein